MDLSKQEENDVLKMVKDAESEAMSKKQKDASTKYHYTYVGMEEVMKKPEEYIIPELRRACKKLWDKNIFTFMCSDRNDGGHSYILLETLSQENQSIFDKLKKKHPKNFIFDQFRNCLRIDFITANMIEKEIAKLFNKVANKFILQDVQERFYITRERFLIDCGCYKEVPNPDYIKNPGPMPVGADLKALDEWFSKINQPKNLKVFDETKVTKPIEQYLKEKGITTYDPVTQRIYQSEFFLQRHLDYVEKLKQAQKDAITRNA